MVAINDPDDENPDDLEGVEWTERRPVIGDPHEENSDDFDGMDWAERLLGLDQSEQREKHYEALERGNNYTKDWEFVSWEFLKSKDFTCESCGANLTEHKHEGLLYER